MKIFIVAPEHINKLEVANAIVALDDDLNICKMFTSKMNETGLIGEYMFYLDVDDIVLSFRNNALLFIDYRNENITGITLDDFDSSDIIIINTAHFNTIPDTPFNENELLIIWLDDKMQLDQRTKKKNMIESKYLQERINNLNLPMLYFINEDKDDIAKTVIDYINSDNEHRKEILDENS